MRNDTGEEWLQISDTTTDLLGLKQPLSKLELELVQIRFYQELARKQLPALDFEIEEQGDKPDFIVHRHGERLGIDVAALAFTNRRTAIAQFEGIKECLRLAYRKGRLRQCRGIEIRLSFRGQGIPRAASLDSAISNLVETLETFKIDEQAHALCDDGEAWSMGLVPDWFPMGNTGCGVDGLILWEVTGDCTAQNSFAAECGFNVEYQFLQTVNASEVKKRLDEIIAQHDKSDEQGIDELAIVAGGPLQNGEGTLDEALLADTFVNHWKGVIDTPTKIRRVVLLNWRSGNLDVLYDWTPQTNK